jgi:hypothetical protein
MCRFIAERPGTLKIPNAALRFQPEGASQRPGAQDTVDRSGSTQATQQRLTQAFLTSESKRV